MKARRGRYLYLGVALLGAGVLLLGATGAYVGYAAVARSQLDRLVVTAGEATQAQTPSEADTLAETVAAIPSGQVASSPGPLPEPQFALVDVVPAPGPSLLPPERSLYPGEQVLSKYWADPLRAAPPDPRVQDLTQGFLPVQAKDALSLGATLAQATQIFIPSIEVDAGTSELAILDLGDSRAYETPNNIVGHIPGTANPGQPGNGWYFGHLESPLRGEGNVFQKLPKIPQLLRQGDEVPVILQTEDAQYLYRVVSTDVVHQDQLQLYDSDDPTITLVACVPRLVYDYRLLVNAELVGVRPLTPPSS